MKAEVPASHSPPSGRRTSAAAVEVLLDCLEELGVRHVFGNPGTTEQGLIAALAERRRLTYVLGLHETVAVAMADGYSRATGEPSFVNLHISAGLANGLSQLQNASYGRSPVVVTAGQSDSRLLVEEPLLAADSCAMAAQFTKWCWELRQATDVPTAIRRAFKVAVQPPAGPVFLSLPLDRLDEPIPLPPPSTGRVFSRVRHEQAGIEAAAAELRKATHPVVLCGDDVGRTNAVHALVELAATLGAAVFATAQAHPNFPNDHPLFARTVNVNSPRTRELLAGADCYLAVGTPLFSQFLHLDEPLLSPDIPVIQLDESGWEVAKNAPVTVGLVGDLAALCADLSAELERVMSDRERASADGRRREAEERKRQARVRLAKRLEPDAARGISNLRVMTALQRALPSNAIVVEEAPTSAGALQQVFSLSQPGSFFAARGGALGWGLPGALGIQLASPGRVVAAVVGDGAALYSLQALWTAAHYRLPVKVVVANNRGYGILKVNLAAHLGESTIPAHFLGMDILDPEVDFAALAAGFGVSGERIAQPEELEPALERALAAEGPYLLDVRLGEDA